MPTHKFRCSSPDCKKYGKHLPRYTVPAQGISLEAASPLSVIFALQVCDAHWATRTAENWEPEFSRLKTVMTAQAEKHDLVPPDHARGFITAVKVDSCEHRKFIKTVLHTIPMNEVPQ